MADSDYDSRDSRDDDRPRRRDRDDDDRPKKKGGAGMVILFVVLGAVLLLCVLPCGGFIWWSVDLVNKVSGSCDDFLTKVGNGDYTGAYNSTTPGYKARRTLEQFTADMKAAKLDKYKAKSFKFVSSTSVNTTHNWTGTVELTDGTTPTVTVVIEQGGNGFQFTVDDIKAPGIPAPK